MEVGPSDKGDTEERAFAGDERISSPSKKSQLLHQPSLHFTGNFGHRWKQSSAASVVSSAASVCSATSEARSRELHAMYLERVLGFCEALQAAFEKQAEDDLLTLYKQLKSGNADFGPFGNKIPQSLQTALSKVQEWKQELVEEEESMENQDELTCSREAENQDSAFEASEGSHLNPVALLVARDEALLYLQNVVEDCKSRLANQQHMGGPLHLQLEVMANNLKAMAKALETGLEDANAVFPNGAVDDDETEDADQLFGWGDQLCQRGHIVLEDKHRIKGVACNGGRGLYVTHTGDVFSIGDNGTGVPSSTHQRLDSTTPKVVGELVLERVLLGRRVVFVACGHLHSCALTQGGRLWSWGCGQHGRLGHGDERDQPVPRLCEALLTSHVRAVACGGAHTVAVVSPSRVFSWGLGRHGRLGLGDPKGRCHNLPQLVDVDTNAMTMSDAYHAFFGQPVPKPVKELIDEPIVSVACGWAFTLLLGANGTVRAFGAGVDGQCGISPAQDQLVPTVVPDLSGRGVVQISCGYHHAIAVTCDGTMFTWGMGEEGQLGQGSVIKKSERPKAVVIYKSKRLSQQNENGMLLPPPPSPQPQSGPRVTFAVAGQFHSLCTLSDSSLWGWGSNLHSAVACEAPHKSSNKVLWWEPREIDLEGMLEDPDGDGKGKRSSSSKRSRQRRKNKKEAEPQRQIKQLAAGAHFTIAVYGSNPRKDLSTPADFGGPLLSNDEVASLNKKSLVSFEDAPSLLHDSPISPALLNLARQSETTDSSREMRAAAALVSQVNTGSFCGGRIGFWDRSNGSYLPRIGVLTSTGTLELYKELNANFPERVVTFNGHDVEVQCKENVLEVWRARTGQEYSLLLRIRLNSRIETAAWAEHISKHSSTEQKVYHGAAGAQNSLVNGRRSAWRAAIGNHLRITPELYTIYKERATRQEGIGLDVKRTLPALLLFGKRGEPLYEQLREVLEVFQCYRCDCGYVQGMSYIGAMLCLHVPNDPYECFVCLANLLASHHLFDFFRINRAYGKVQRYYEVLDLIIAKTSPRLWRHLCRLHVVDEIHVACFQWLQTMFVRRLPLEQATQLWDAFLCGNDTMVMMRACVALLVCMEKSILAVSEPEDILLLLRATHRLDDLIKITFTVVQVPHLAQEKLNTLTEA